jgi:hypothetical protein
VKKPRFAINICTGIKASKGEIFAANRNPWKKTAGNGNCRKNYRRPTCHLHAGKISCLPEGIKKSR